MSSMSVMLDRRLLVAVLTIIPPSNISSLLLIEPAVVNVGASLVPVTVTVAVTVLEVKLSSSFT